jgi:hypothetical protein
LTPWEWGRRRPYQDLTTLDFEEHDDPHWQLNMIMFKTTQKKYYVRTISIIDE